MDIDFILAAIGGMITGGGIVAGITAHSNQRLVSSLREHARLQQFTMDLLSKKLGNLRKNAFITNELGHRVRYSKASPDLRAMAETE